MPDDRTIILHWTASPLGGEWITDPMEFNGAAHDDLQAASLWRAAAERRGCDYIVIFAGQPRLDELTGMIRDGVPLISHPSAILPLPVGAP